MRTLRELLEDYLGMRRGLGFKLTSDGAALASFVRFMEQVPAEVITTELALAWATQPTKIPPARWAARLRFVRGFAGYCNAIDQRMEVPPAALLPFAYRRPSPYFYTDDDLNQLLQGALQWPAKQGLANHTYYCLFGLLSVSGLRIGEALRLRLDDVDLDAGLLTIRATKFGKNRLVPLHPSTVTVLTDYRQRRTQFLAGRQVVPWFVNVRGEPLGYDEVRGVFRALTAELPNQPGRARPRLHDLRHRFALTTLVQWYRTGQDVQRQLPVLSAFLGHTEVSDTYWYLSACPALLEAATARLERHWERTA